MAKHPELERFEKLLRGVEGTHYRLTRGLLTGRNSDATWDALQRKLREMGELVESSDAVCEALDAEGSKLSLRYRRAERFALLGETYA